MSESNNRAPIPVTYMEQIVGDEPLGTEKMPRFTSQVTIKVISYRKRLTDTDGISVKAVLDGIVKSGILQDDSSDQVKSVTFENRKTKTEEKTYIEIEGVLE